MVFLTSTGMEFSVTILVFPECVLNSKKKKGGGLGRSPKDKQELFTLETHHPEIIPDDIIVYMITLLYFFYIYIYV